MWRICIRIQIVIGKISTNPVGDSTELWINSVPERHWIGMQHHPQRIRARPNLNPKALRTETYKRQVRSTPAFDHSMHIINWTPRSGHALAIYRRTSWSNVSWKCTCPSAMRGFTRCEWNEPTRRNSKGHVQKKVEGVGDTVAFGLVSFFLRKSQVWIKYDTVRNKAILICIGQLCAFLISAI